MADTPVTNYLQQLTPEQMAQLDKQNEAVFGGVKYDRSQTEGHGGEGGDWTPASNDGYTSIDYSKNPYGTYYDYDTSGKLTGTHEGEKGMSSGDFIKIVAPIALNIAFPGLGNAVGAVVSDALGLGLGMTGSTVLGNSIVNTVLNGGDAKKAVIGAVAAGAGTEVANSAALSDALKKNDITGVIATSIKDAAAGATSAAVQGKDIVTGALASAGGRLISTGVMTVADDAGARPVPRRRLDRDRLACDDGRCRP